MINASSTDDSDGQDQTRFDTDVVVVGAGPVGLTLACALGHHGVRYRVFEQLDEAKANSKANNVWARPQELLAGVGLRDALAENSYAVKHMNVVIDGSPLDQVALGQVDSPYPDALYTGQDVIESTLERVTGESGGPVERGRVVDGFEQDGDGVTVRVRSAGDDDGDLERVRCRYLVGADGVEGSIAEGIGLTVDPRHFEGRATRQIDAKLSWRRSTEPDQMWFFLYHEGFAGVMPIWGGRHRLFLLENEADVPDRDPTLGEMQARAREVIGDETIALEDPVWFSHGRFQHGVTNAYASDRVFLAGDAGHQTLPIGGQGMNAGMTDGIALAWRLAMTLAGDGGPDILDSYSPERRGVHIDLDDQQAKGFERLMYRGRLADAALRVAGDAVPNLGSQVFGGDDLQQLTVGYRDSVLSEERFRAPSLSHRGALRAGDRAADARVVLADGTTTSLHDRIHNPDGLTWGWALLAFDGADAGVAAILTAACDAVAPWRWVRPRLVVAAPKAPERSAGAHEELFDLDEVVHRAYGLAGGPALVLVRPDGHIGFRGPVETDPLVAYCRRVSGS